MESAPFPRVLLLTNWRPDGKYAGAEAMRRILGCFPPDRIRWASLQELGGSTPHGLPETRAFPPKRLHWRLERTPLSDVWVYSMQARQVARRIADWVSDHDPEVLWVLPELGAINVAFHLSSLLPIPMHATLYDAPESARDVCLSSLYYPIYMRGVRRVFARFSSVDAVSQGLLDHVQESGLLNDCCGKLVLPASVPASWMTNRDANRQMPEPPGNGNVRRIGFCGAFRVSAGQWQSFLGSLSALPFEFEIIAFAEEASVPRCRPAGNVRLFLRPYVANEAELIDTFRREEIHAGYTGLWRSPGRSIFARTSLSSKLTTYAAAGMPIIVDGPRESAVWRAVEEHGAGILVDEAATPELMRLFADNDAWRRMAEGASRLCRSQFDLVRNAHHFAELLRATASAGGEE